MTACAAERCGHWTGDGCACAVMGLDPTCGACEAGIHEQCDRVTNRGRSCCCDEGDEDR